MKQIFDDLRMIVVLHLMSLIISIAPKNEDGNEVLLSIKELLEKQIEKK